MRRYERQRGAGVNKHTGHRAKPDRSAHSAKTKRRPKKSKSRLEEPSAVMKRQPAPGLIPQECPSEERIIKPVTVTEWRPAHADPVGPPTVAVTANGKPRAVSVEIGKPGRISVRRAGVLHRRGGGGYHAVDAAGHPTVKTIVIGQPSNVERRIVARAHGERLALLERRGAFLVKNVNVAFGDVDAAAIVEIIQPEAGPPRRLDRKVAAGNAEIVITAGVDIDRNGSLTK